MASVVEICGAPGVGKTTLLNELINKWDTKKTWLPANYLYPKRKVRFGFIGKALLSLADLYNDKEGWVDERQLRPYRQKFVAQYPEFVDACWHWFSSYDTYYHTKGIDFRLEKLTYLYHTMQRFQLLKEASTEKVVLFDEGLVHRIVNSLFKRGMVAKDREMVSRFLEIMPLPEAILYIKADSKEIINRLKQRKKVIVEHKHMNEQELEQDTIEVLNRMEYFIDALSDKGIPVKHIDSGWPVKQSVDESLKFLQFIS